MTCLSRAARTVALLAAVSAANAATFITSNFDTDTEGWLPIEDVDLHWQPVGGVSGGFLEGIDGADGFVWYYQAPGKFLGNRSTALNQTFSFYLWTDHTDGGVGKDVLIEGPFHTLVASLPGVPGTNWTQYSFTLGASNGWRINEPEGSLATAEQIQAVLSDIHSITIRGEYYSHKDIGGLDSVTLAMSEPIPVRNVPLISTFDTSDEGWYEITNEVAYKLTWKATGGNPDGNVSGSDVGSGTWFYASPPSFTGNVSAAYGRDLTFDLTQSSLATQYDSLDVVLVGSSFRLVYDTPYNPQKTWTHYRVPIVAGAWKVDNLDGPVATEAQFREVLSDLHSLRIRGEYRSWSDVGTLDNVYFGVASLPGDVNRDGSVDELDVLSALRIAGGLQTATDLSSVDLEPAGGDGRVELADAVRVMRLVQ